MTDVPYTDPDCEEERLAARLRLLGTDTPRCSTAGCQERDPFALTGVHPSLLCAEHRADRDGRRWLEESHTAGQHNLPNDTVPIPANDHSVVSDRLQVEWPRETLRNPDGSPVLRAAGALRGWLDTLRLILERTCGWVPTFLEGLDAWLRMKLGERWWEEFDHWRDESDQ
jgi:hypothetical protein